jgi:hypothetical protein
MVKVSTSTQGQRPSRWGFIIWTLWITLTYYWKEASAEKIETLIRMIELYLTLLYCRFCRQSLQDFWFLRNPRDYLSQSKLHSLFDWVYWLHEQVNIKLFKPAYPFKRLYNKYIKNEMYYWEQERVSPHWRYCYWSSLYLLATNYPVKIESANEKQVQHRANLVELLQILTQEIIPNSNLRETMRAYTLDNEDYHIAKQEFSTRAQVFEFIYKLEIANHTESCFGDTIDQVSDYFEVCFRSNA